MKFLEIRYCKVSLLIFSYESYPKFIFAHGRIFVYSVDFEETKWRSCVGHDVFIHAFFLGFSSSWLISLINASFVSCSFVRSVALFNQNFKSVDECNELEQKVLGCFCHVPHWHVEDLKVFSSRSKICSEKGFDVLAMWSGHCLMICRDWKVGWNTWNNTHTLS